jgi:bifunctional UDP-N-acetylglucosamine pyrophosphorylase / glucosamine-1-phosphate N-acetyltransferase
MSRRSRAAVILAAGQGTRMRSALPKVLHAIAGRSMLGWSVALARACGCERVIVVTSPLAPQVADAARAMGCDSAIQDPPLGTGHAVRSAEAALAGFDGDVVVLFADTPLVRPETVGRVLALLEDGAQVAVLGFEAAVPGGYGRLVRNPDGTLARIVEAKDATEAERAISFCNSGVLAAPSKALFSWLAEIRNENAAGEYYLPDVIGLAVRDGAVARAATGTEAEVMGANSRAELAAAEAAFQARRRAEVMAEGVTLVAPETVFFSHDTALAADVTIEPNVVFGPGVTVATGAVIRAFSHLEGAVVGEGAEVGPYARLRPGTVLGRKAKVGNFVEVKKTTFGEGAKANHLSYLGDAEIGAAANIGAGTITCNYDGFDKFRTIIGAGAFIGSNAALVAPVTIGAGAYTASGSVITEDVAPDALAFGRARQSEKPGWAISFRAQKAATKAARATGE